MKKTLPASVLLLLLLLTAAGCGPTRKEYAINEALLIDQTRILENQLYSAQFRIQQLERENERLRRQLEGKEEPLSAKKRGTASRGDTARVVPIAPQPLDEVPAREVANSGASAAAPAPMAPAQVRRAPQAPNLPQEDLPLEEMRQYQATGEQINARAPRVARAKQARLY
ncbi:MAG: hypothetical protein J6S75_01160 [Thermoguttaceae bacterium]|nr:hypothetical protein [Thermoguttaceae bacterium]